MVREVRGPTNFRLLHPLRGDVPLLSPLAETDRLLAKATDYRQKCDCTCNCFFYENHKKKLRL